MPRLPGLIQIAVLLLAVACSPSPRAAAAIGTPAQTQAPGPKGPQPAASAPQAAPESHPLDDTAAAPGPAMDPIPRQDAGAAPSAGGLLVPGRPRKPLVRSTSSTQGPVILPLGSDIPDGPVAAADAPRQDCAEPRPTACNLDYKPVCADVDTGVRCITTPCPSNERKTFGSACKACRNPKVRAFVSGTCPTH